MAHKKQNKENNSEVCFRAPPCHTTERGNVSVFHSGVPGTPRAERGNVSTFRLEGSPSTPRAELGNVSAFRSRVLVRNTNWNFAAELRVGWRRRGRAAGPGGGAWMCPGSVIPGQDPRWTGTASASVCRLLSKRECDSFSLSFSFSLYIKYIHFSCSPSSHSVSRSHLSLSHLASSCCPSLSRETVIYTYIYIFPLFALSLYIYIYTYIYI